MVKFFMALRRMSIKFCSLFFNSSFSFDFGKTWIDRIKSNSIYNQLTILRNSDFKLELSYIGGENHIIIEILDLKDALCK